MRHLQPRLVAAAVGAALVVAACLVETTTYRQVGPGQFGLTITALAIGAAVAPWVPTLGVLAAAITFPLQVLITPGIDGIGGSALVTMMVLVGYGALRLAPVWSVPGAVLAVAGGGGGLVASGDSAFEFVFFGTTMGGAWLVGWLLRRERERAGRLRRLAAQLAAERERSARGAVIEERARISRELHDAVAHSVSVMTLQVAVVRRRLVHGIGLPEEGPEAAALGAVEELGRRSVDELRRVVGMLQESDLGPDTEPPPSLTRVQALQERFAAVGLHVAIDTRGESVPLAPAMDASAFRIVAEALTNVLRHSGTTEAEVLFDWQPDRLGIEVLDRGTGTSASSPSDDEASGNGLLGLKQRAEMFGGTLAAGARAGGGFRLRAELPLSAAGLHSTAQTSEVGPG